MKPLWDLIGKIAIESHSTRIETWARILERFEHPRSLAGILDGLNADTTAQLDQVWQQHPVPGAVIAAALLAASSTARQVQQNQHIELVWTGPTTNTVPIRHTEQVLLEMINAAQSSIFMVSFVAYTVDSIVRALNTAVDRSVQVNIMLESASNFGGRLTIDSVAKMREAVPMAFVYVWDSKAKHDHSVGGKAVVHAKCIVADAKNAFLTSANLSAAALERNLEAGVLVNGGILPKQLERLLRGLISTKTFVRV